MRANDIIKKYSDDPDKLREVANDIAVDADYDHDTHAGYDVYTFSGGDKIIYILSTEQAFLVPA